MTESGYDAQVVRVSEGHTYELDDRELQNILLNDEIQDLPVMVVSVAGAFRRGKSFLLNFFLRYLSSSPSARADGSWIGSDSEQLVGFSWRSGPDRNTTGILFWSEPFVMTLPTKQKVAVILMDTQGTFDSESSTKDCSTIFALSTLLSSVQIYNLSLNIQEDDLQHLEYFIEYGKMVKDKEGTKPFQVLEFLVRDWQSPDDFEFGAAGGEKFLKKILQITPNHPKEVNDVREHIKSSFEVVSCFLMPHPGLKVSRKKFTGKISEIEPEFIMHLKNLVTSLFSPEKLMPKRINGELIRARDLYTYFKSYMSIFNSNSVPSTDTIMAATVKAGMLSAMQEARMVYETGMDAECGEKKPSLPGYDLLDIHQKYLGQARATFTTKKKMGSTSEAKRYLDDLTKELENRLPLYQQSNIAKTEATIKKANETYKQMISNVTKGKPLCVHPTDLIEINKQAYNAAVKVFDNFRKHIKDAEDIEREVYVDGLKQRFFKLRSDNEQSNSLIASQIRIKYWSHMQEKCNIDPPLSESELKKEHDAALEKAMEEFDSKRNRSSNQYGEDVYRFNLIRDIDNNFISMKNINKSKNKAAMQKGIAAYNDYMNSAWDKSMFLHTMEFEKEHYTGLCRALLEYRPRKTCDVGFDKNDSDEKALMDIIDQRYREMKEINDKASESAVQMAYNYYHDKMAELCRPTVNCWFTEEKLDSEKKQFHDKTSAEAIKIFKSKRRTTTFAADAYEQNLQQLMEAVYNKYLGKK